MKVLKIWNGRCHGAKYRRHHAYVAAYSIKQARELLSMAFFGKEHPNLISGSEIRDYYNAGSWGNVMEGIEPTEPCVYLCDETIRVNKPFKVI